LSEAPGASGDLRFDVRFDEPQLRRVVRAYVLRLISPFYWIVLAAVASGLAFHLRMGDRSWFVGVLAAALALGIGMPLMGWRVRLLQAMETLRRLDPPTAHVVVDAAGLRIASSAGSLIVRWPEVTRVLDVGEAWIVQLGSHHATLPYVGLEETTRQDFVDRVRAAGIRID
jgi:hypothetical protein